MNKKILIVEDDPLFAKVLKDALVNEKFDVILAKDGEEGLNLALSAHPDLILLDIILPKMDGLTMFNKLQNDEWGRDVPVMIVTAVKDRQRLQEAKQKGIYYYLIKEDFRAEDVVAKVKERLGFNQPAL